MTRKTTDEGKNYQHYTYLGGDTKAFLPSPDRAKLLVHLFDDHITMVRAQQWESDTMDAIIYMATKAQPLTKLHCLSIEPTTFRDLMAREYNIRKERDPEGTGNLINFVMSAGDDQASLVSEAMRRGFTKFDIDTVKMARVGSMQPRGRQAAATPTDTQDDIAMRLQHAEHLKQEAMHQREAALLEFQTAELQRKTAEEEAKRQAAWSRILQAAKTPRLIIAATTPPRTPTAPKEMSTAQTPPLADMSPDRAQEITQALVERAARLGQPIGQGPPSAMASHMTGKVAISPVVATPQQQMVQGPQGLPSTQEQLGMAASPATAKTPSTPAKRPVSTTTSGTPSAKTSEPASQKARTQGPPSSATARTSVGTTVTKNGSVEAAVPCTTKANSNSTVATKHPSSNTDKLDTRPTPSEQACVTQASKTNRTKDGANPSATQAAMPPPCSKFQTSATDVAKKARTDIGPDGSNSTTSAPSPVSDVALEDVQQVGSIQDNSVAIDEPSPIEGDQGEAPRMEATLEDMDQAGGKVDGGTKTDETPHGDGDTKEEHEVEEQQEEEADEGEEKHQKPEEEPEEPSAAEETNRDTPEEQEGNEAGVTEVNPAEEEGEEQEEQEEQEEEEEAAAAEQELAEPEGSKADDAEVELEHHQGEEEAPEAIDIE